MSTTLEPTGDRLFVEPIEEEKVLRSGLILPDNVGEKPHRGIIIALGPLVGAENEKAGVLPPGGPGLEGALVDRRFAPLKLGDEVLYSKYGGTEMKVDLREVVMLRESDVFCRVVEVEEPAVEHDLSDDGENGRGLAREERPAGKHTPEEIDSMLGADRPTSASSEAPGEAAGSESQAAATDGAAAEQEDTERE